jgi:hypothetical protein
VTTYDAAMSAGAREYSDVLSVLADCGRAAFTQTGGWCAAIEVVPEAGYTLLITDADEPLSWSRAEHAGWRVSLYGGEATDLPLASRNSVDGSLESLRSLIEVVLRTVGQTV